MVCMFCPAASVAINALWMFLVIMFLNMKIAFNSDKWVGAVDFPKKYK